MAYLNKPLKDAGTIQVLLKRLNEERLPEALRMEKKVDQGECLDDYEMRLLKTVMKDAAQVRGLAQKYPEYQPLVDRLSTLYAHISEKALENQQKAAGPGRLQ